VQEVVKNVVVATHFHGPTVAAILTDEGYVLIDAPPFADDARHWKKSLATYAEAPMRAMILTDTNPERLLGAHHMNADVMIAHEASYRHLKSLPSNYANAILTQMSHAAFDKSDTSDGRIVLPNVTFEDQIKLEIGDVEVTIENQPGPDRGSIWVKYLNQGLLFSGDIVVVGQAPYLNNTNSEKWLTTLQTINHEEFPANIIIPGHGKVTAKNATEAMIQYLQIARERVQELHTQGLSLSDTRRLIHELLNFFPPPLESELASAQYRVRTALQYIYNELRQGHDPDNPPLTESASTDGT
jgi:glyoxylase-like metal-dependent hydrolase (beta-lactamase superfamily II)